MKSLYRCRIVHRKSLLHSSQAGDKHTGIWGIHCSFEMVVVWLSLSGLGVCCLVWPFLVLGWREVVGTQGGQELIYLGLWSLHSELCN